MADRIGDAVTQYRLTAIKFVEVVSRDASGRPTAQRRYKQGDVIELTGSEEQRLLAAGALAPLVDEVAEEVVADPDADSDTPDPDATPVAGGEVERPRKAGPVDEWRAYAVTKGIDAAKAAEMTKSELIEAVGED